MVPHAKRKHGEKRQTNGVRTEGLRVHNLLSSLVCKRSKKLEKVLKSEKSLSKDIETFRKQYCNEKRLMGQWNDKLWKT